MAISSQGIGSGLDVNSIVTQLVAIEKQPLTQLKSKASTIQTQLSTFGTFKSQASSLGDAAATLALSSGWNLQSAVSSNTSAVAVSLSGTATAASLSVEVEQLAQAQSSASAGVSAGSAIGATGIITIQLGSWSGTPTAQTFTAGTSSAVDVSIDSADTTSQIAAKINAANAGVTATVLRDGVNERLVLRSTSTGATSGFSVTTSGDPGVGQFAMNDAGGPVDPTNASPVSGMSLNQLAVDAKVKINGVGVSASSNKLTDIVPGINLQISQTTSAPVAINVSDDLAAIQKNVQTFIDAYNALNSTIATSTKYDATTKTGGPLQGDFTTLGVQSTLRSVLGSTSSGSTFSRLSDAGIERQTDGSLKLNTTKFTTALADLTNLKSLFTTDNGNAATNGFGIKVRDVARSFVAFDGRISTKTTSLQDALSRNSKDQSKVNDRAATVEANLRKQYAALDTEMAKWTGLSSYVTSQIAQWNKTS
jgi:flagellar hook-associated protein 2